MDTSPDPAPLDRPYRGAAAGRPRGVAIPPERLPLFRGWQLRKRWHYVTFWSPEVLLCAAKVQVGLLDQQYWAVWDRAERRMWTKTRFLRRRVHMLPGRLAIDDGAVSAEVTYEPTDRFEVYRPEGRAYIWSSKELCTPSSATVRLGERVIRTRGTTFVDVNAGYHRRRTRWRWSAGSGTDDQGRPVAWNAIVGLFDTPESSERTVWIEGAGRELGPVRFSDDLNSVAFAEGGRLEFREEATLRKRVGLFLLRSKYDHAFGVYSGTLPGGIQLGEGFGVRERQDALW